MDQKKLYLFYGIVIAFLGIVGFILTHAKSALISGLASGAVLIGLSFFAGGSVGLFFSRLVNVLLLGTFTWRTTLALTALNNGHPDKLTPTVLLSMMALVSAAVLGISFLTKGSVAKDRL